MKRIILITLCCLSANSFIFASPVIAKPTEESLINAWEEVQKSDSETVTFERLEDRLYKFKTKHFPFDGKIKIKDVVIDDIMMGTGLDFGMGTIEIELIDTPEDFQKTYSRRYYMWARNNILYYDRSVQKWISSKELQEIMAKKLKEQSKPSSMPIVLDIVLIVFLVFILAYVQISSKKSRQEYKRITDTSLQLSEKGIKASEETNKILKEILEALKSRN